MRPARMQAISPEKFYKIRPAAGSVKNEFQSALRIKCSRKMPDHILGPTQFWKEYRKQADALATAAEHGTEADPLCTFVSQRELDGVRSFITAHPEVYWWFYEQFPASRRCSYEVIPEGMPCRLYLDLEYIIELNPASEGECMTDTLIEILCAYLLAYWGMPVNKYNIINLDSTTEEKFSRHLIFVIKDVAFKDNYHAGRFIKSMCYDIQDYATSKKEHKVLSQFDRSLVEKLIVNTKNGKGIFVDTGVYTKNRHFRIFMSTKWGKNSHLMLASDCKYIPIQKHVNLNQSIFLDSLVTFFQSKKDLILLQFGENQQAQSKPYNSTEQRCKLQREYDRCESDYQMLDDYVRKLISPGRIRAIKDFGESGRLIYDTAGYRYCENIGRCHKSNNVFLVVDLHKKVMYQKCHDRDCIGFKSQAKELPEEIGFHIDDIFLTHVMKDVFESTD